MYNKLFSKIVTSSVWLAPSDHRVVWITFLALMDQDGFVPIASVPNLAHTANVSVEAAKAAVEAFESPDSLDPEQEFEGRRIEKVPNGWIVLNAPKYAAMATAEKAREQTRERVRAFRERKSNGSVTVRNARVTQANGNVTPSDQIRSDHKPSVGSLSRNARAAARAGNPSGPAPSGSSGKELERDSRVERLREREAEIRIRAQRSGFRAQTSVESLEAYETSLRLWERDHQTVNRDADST